MRDTQEQYEQYTGAPISPYILHCPACGSFPVSHVSWDKKRYTCELCEDGKE